MKKKINKYYHFFKIFCLFFLTIIFISSANAQSTKQTILEMPPLHKGTVSKEYSTQGKRYLTTELIRSGYQAPQIDRISATTGTNKIIVLLAQFDTDALTTTTGNGRFNNTDCSDVFSPHNAVYFRSVCDSVTKYYRDNSDNKLILSFTVADTIYNLTKKMDYYADSPHLMVIETMMLADTEIDFSQYKSVMIMHAGCGHEVAPVGEFEGDIHSCRLSFSSIVFDGRSFTGGFVIPETLGGYQLVGVIAHEYGHEIGLPDLYDRDGSSDGVGNFCLMSGGSWNGSGATPAPPSAWCKSYLGWLSPELITFDTAASAARTGID